MNEVTQEQPKTGWLESAGRFVDRCIYAIAPVYGAQRMQFRKGYTALSAFEGASHTQARSSSWIGSRLSVDSVLEEDLETLRTRSRELYRTDSFGGTIDDKVNHVVGTGFMPQSRIDPKIVGTEAAEVFNAEIEALYERWAKQCDISGRESLWQQSRLMARHLEFDGEGIAVLSDDPDPMRPIPLAIEVIDPERVETPPEKLNDPLVRLGVERTTSGKVVAYWIRKTNPYDTVAINFEYDRVPAWRVMHVYEKWFASQSRGLPWLCRAMNRLKDCKDLDEAEIIAAQVQACFAVFVRQGYSPQGAAQAAATGTDGTHRLQEIRPGGIHYTGMTDEIQFAAPSRPGGTFGPFQEWNYRRVAAAVNWPYEMLIKNWGGLSFAAGRLVLSGLKLDVKSRQKLIDEAFLTPVWNRMVDESVMLGRSSIEPRLWAERPWVYQRHKWTPPAWSYAITPGEEIKAQVEAINNNLMTAEEAIAQNGGDMEEVFERRKREMQLQRDADILPPEQAKADAEAQAAEAAQQQANNPDPQLAGRAA